jgi:hypothetical protein
MKRLGSFSIVACALALASSAAYAKPVGTLTCSSSSSGQLKFNVSFFNFGLDNTLNIGSQSSGAGSGKVTFSPLEVHASLSTFATLMSAAANGSAFQSCLLNTTLSDGSQTEFEFKLVAIKSLNAVASMPAQANEPARYTDVNFEYGAIEVRSPGSADDGGTGTTTTGGWNIVTNQNQ